MSIAIVGDHLIHYEAIGRGEPLIFVHGWLGSWRYWWPSMQALSARHKTFAFDLWGYGDSSKEPRKYTFDNYVEMLGEFVDKLGISRPVTLVGHSLGGAVALRFAVKNPERVKRLVTVALPVAGSYVHERLVSSDSPSFISKVLGKTNSFPEIDGEVRKTDTLALNSVATELQGIDLVTDIERCPRPILLVFGELDEVVRQPTGSQLYLQQPGDNRAYVALGDCNHFPMLEQPAKFNRLILDFVMAENDVASLAPKEYWQRRTH